MQRLIDTVPVFATDVARLAPPPRMRVVAAFPERLEPSMTSERDRFARPWMMPSSGAASRAAPGILDAAASLTSMADLASSPRAAVAAIARLQSLTHKMAVPEGVIPPRRYPYPPSARAPTTSTMILPPVRLLGSLGAPMVLEKKNRLASSSCVSAATKSDAATADDLWLEIVGSMPPAPTLSVADASLVAAPETSGKANKSNVTTSNVPKTEKAKKQQAGATRAAIAKENREAMEIQDLLSFVWTLVPQVQRSEASPVVVLTAAASLPIGSASQDAIAAAKTFGMALLVTKHKFTRTKYIQSLLRQVSTDYMKMDDFWVIVKALISLILARIDAKRAKRRPTTSVQASSSAPPSNEPVPWVYNAGEMRTSVLAILSNHGKDSRSAQVDKMLERISQLRDEPVMMKATQNFISLLLGRLHMERAAPRAAAGPTAPSPSVPGAAATQPERLDAVERDVALGLMSLKRVNSTDNEEDPKRRRLLN